MFKNNNEIIIYANPSSGNTEYKDIPQVNEKDKAWKDVDQAEHENYTEIDYVPLDGSDKSNIPAKYANLIRPCFCFQLQHEVETHTPLEIVKVRKDVNYHCQIDASCPNYKGHTSTYNHDQIKLMEDMGFKKYETGKKSTRTKVQTDIYNPAKEDTKLKAFKNEGKKIQQDNKDTKDRIDKSINVCNLLVNLNTNFGSCMKIFKHCTVTKKVSTIVSSTIWKDLHDHNHNQMFYQFLSSQVPTAYVDITFDFLLNSITMGIFRLKYKDTQTLRTSWTPVIKLGDKKIQVVSDDNQS